MAWSGLFVDVRIQNKTFRRDVRRIVQLFLPDHEEEQTSAAAKDKDKAAAPLQVQTPQDVQASLTTAQTLNIICSLYFVIFCVCFYVTVRLRTSIIISMYLCVYAILNQLFANIKL